MVHPDWILVQPITCNCDAKQPLLVKLGPNQQPTVCPGCLNVYGVVMMDYFPAKNRPLQIGVGVIGVAQKEAPAPAVTENTH